MTLESAIAHFRTRQQDLFRDTATVTRAIGEPAFNPETGEPTHGTSVVYSGRCLLRGLDWQGSDRGYGDVEVRLRGIRGKFPPDTPIKFNDLITPDSSTYDANLVGVVFRVTDVVRDGWQIARVVIAEEVFDQ